MNASNLHCRLGVRRVLNGTGTWTNFGSAVVPGEVASAVAEALQSAFVIDDLQDAASAAIARATGADAGFVTNCSAAGLTLAAAACLSGSDLARIRRLPRADWPKREIVLQKGHAVDFGAEVTQMLALAGADVVEAGAANWCEAQRLESAVTERTAGALFVVSHLCVQRNVVPLGEFCAIFRGRGVPVIVDAAAESDIRGMHAAGADLVIHSLQKFPQGPTAGIISGRSDLIAAVRAQLAGIGRPMKAPKEAIAGAMATLEHIDGRDAEAIRRRDADRLRRAAQDLVEIEGLAMAVVADPTGNPFDRLELRLDPAKAGMTAMELAQRLLAHDPVVATRDSGAEHGILLVDPRSLDDHGLTEVCSIIRDVLRDRRGVFSS